MTETTHTCHNGHEYDAQFTDFTMTQLRDALAAANTEYQGRCDHWDACYAEVGAASLAAVTNPGAENRARLAEARAAMRGAHALATEQGKIVSAINRAILHLQESGVWA